MTSLSACINLLFCQLFLVRTYIVFLPLSFLWTDSEVL